MAEEADDALPDPTAEEDTPSAVDEESKKRSLHAAIFGDDDDSDDDNLPTLTREDKLQQILAAAKEKKQAAAKKGKGKGKTKAADTAPPRKRLKQGAPAPGSGGGGTSAAGAGAADSEEGEQAAGVPDGGFREEGEDGVAPVYDSEDSEEEGGGKVLEAVEEGGKHDLDNILQKMKGRRGQIVRSREELKQEVLSLQQRMDTAAERDDAACRSGGCEPAVNKVAMLPEVLRMLGKRHLHEVMIDQGMLTTLASWLKPMPDGSLVSLQIRSDLLKALAVLEIDETVLGSLRSSGLGKYVRLYSLHQRETQPNRKQANALVEKWKRPIFGSSMAYSAAEVPQLEGRSATELLASVEVRRTHANSHPHLHSTRPPQPPPPRPPRLTCGACVCVSGRVGRGADRRQVASLRHVSKGCASSAQDVPAFRPATCTLPPSLVLSLSSPHLSPRSLQARLDAPVEEEADSYKAKAEGKTQGGTRVPRPIGMDFKAQPAARVAPLPSAKYTKESTKGKLQEKMMGAKKKKGVSSQAMSVSLEGRGLDRI